MNNDIFNHIINRLLSNANDTLKDAQANDKDEFYVGKTSTLPSQKLQNNGIKLSEFTSGITGGKSPMDSRTSGISV